MGSRIDLLVAGLPGRNWRECDFWGVIMEVLCEVDGAAPTVHATDQNGKAFTAMSTIICNSDLDAPFAL